MSTRIGLIVVPNDDLNDVVLRFLLLHLNTLQTSFQFEFYPFVRKLPVFETLATGVANWDELKPQMKPFLTRFHTRIDELNAGYETSEAPPEHLVIISMARFKDNYFSHRSGSVQVLALGNWERQMAPPSIHEFLITLVLRQTISAMSPSLGGSVHLGTKGCICDMGARLSEVRFKVLNAFVCSYCREKLVDDGLPELADQLTPILGLRWLGKLDDPASPAGIAANLGFKLFVTRGVKPTWRERFLDVIQQEGIKQLIQLAGAILLAAALLWLGLASKK